MNPITIVIAGINDHLHSRGFLSRLREPTTAEVAVWPAIKDILESMGELEDTMKEGAFTKITPRAVFALSPGYALLPDGLKFVYAIVALLLEGKYDVIISAPNREIEMENLRALKAELPAVGSDILNAMRGFNDHSLHMLVLDEVLGLELSNFSRQLKLKPGIDDDHRVIVAISIDFWFRGMEVREEGERRNNSKETRAHLKAMVLRTKPEANQWLHLNLISAVDGSALNWCEQHVLRELMSEDLLFAKISEPEMTVVNFDDHGDCIGEVDRGHIEVFRKLWNLRPYEKTNGEITKIPRLTTAYHKMKEETKGWG